MVGHTTQKGENNIYTMMQICHTSIKRWDSSRELTTYFDPTTWLAETAAAAERESRNSKERHTNSSSSESKMSMRTLNLPCKGKKRTENQKKTSKRLQPNGLLTGKKTMINQKLVLIWLNIYQHILELKHDYNQNVLSFSS